MTCWGLVTLLTAALLALLPSTTLAQEGRLSLTIVPSSLPADGKTHPVAIVQLLAPNRTPVQEKEPVTLFLATSNPEVATLPEQVTVEPGFSYTVIPLAVTYSPGNARITALAAGFGSVSAELETVNPLGAEPPYQIAVSALPPVMGPDKKGVLTLSITDGNGVPYLVPRDTEILLTSSKPDSVDVPGRITISRGQHTARAEWTSLEPGKVMILAQADTLLSGNSQVDVVENADAGPPVYMEAYPLASSLPARETEVDAVMLQALDGERKPVSFPCTEIFVTSSAPRIAEILDSPNTQCDSAAPFVTYGIRTSGTSGEASLTAGAAGLSSSSVIIQTYRLGERRINLSLAPAQPLAQDPTPALLSVQLVDEAGRPVVFHQDYQVALLGRGVDLPATVSIPNGESFAQVPVGMGENVPEEVSALATAPGLEGASIVFEIERRTLDVSLSVPALSLGYAVELTAEVSSEDTPVEGAEVVWEIEGILPSPAVTETDDDGIATISLEVIRISGPITISVRASRLGYEPNLSQTKVVIAGAANTSGGPSRLPFLLMFGAALVMLIAYVIYNTGLYKKWRALTMPGLPHRPKLPFRRNAS